jgi:hypothetical protein
VSGTKDVLLERLQAAIEGKGTVITMLKDFLLKSCGSVRKIDVAHLR